MLILSERERESKKTSMKDGESKEKKKELIKFQFIISVHSTISIWACFP